MESILNSIKKLLGIHVSYSNFDEDLIIHINSVFAVLNQLGVGPKEGFMIEDVFATWDDYTTKCNLTMIKTYMYLKVRLLFDPPTNSFLVDSINRTIAEYEWRIFLEGDTPVEGGETDE